MLFLLRAWRLCQIAVADLNHWTWLQTGEAAHPSLLYCQNKPIQQLQASNYATYYIALYVYIMLYEGMYACMQSVSVSAEAVKMQLIFCQGFSVSLKHFKDISVFDIENIFIPRSLCLALWVLKCSTVYFQCGWANHLCHMEKLFQA